MKRTFSKRYACSVSIFLTFTFFLFLLKFKDIPPEMREGFGEVEVAAVNKIPNLIEEKGKAKYRSLILQYTDLNIRYQGVVAYSHKLERRSTYNRGTCTKGD
jgi:hypothetical protein